MVTLEQVKLLETKVAKAINYVNQVNSENSRLRITLDSYRKRIDELEVLVQQFKEDQSHIEKGIISALDRLNQFEDAIEKSLSTAGAVSASPEASENPGRPGDALKGADFPSQEPPPAAESGGGDLLPASGSAEDTGDPGISGEKPEMPEDPDLSDDVQELDIF
ncbi:MAG: cell division protein ZapB [Treponema sp.]|jgi:hypothetical protein|nr:cell division protein ZapB [Treponema sp.]